MKFTQTGRLQASEEGQVAILFALAIFPILLIAGFAIDFQVLTTNKSRAQSSIDSAVIAGTRAYQEGATQAEVEQRGQQCASAVVDVHDLGASPESYPPGFAVA